MSNNTILLQIYRGCQTEIPIGIIDHFMRQFKNIKPHLEIRSFQFRDKKQIVPGIFGINLEVYDQEKKMKKTIKFLHIEYYEDIKQIKKFSKCVESLMRTDLVLKIFDIFFLFECNNIPIYLIVEQELINMELEDYIEQQQLQSITKEMMQVMKQSIQYCSNKFQIKKRFIDIPSKFQFYIQNQENGQIIIKLNTFNMICFKHYQDMSEQQQQKEKSSFKQNIKQDISDQIQFSSDIITQQLHKIELNSNIQKNQLINAIENQNSKFFKYHDRRIIEQISNNPKYDKFGLEEYGEDYFIIKACINQDCLQSIIKAQRFKSYQEAEVIREKQLKNCSKDQFIFIKVLDCYLISLDNNICYVVIEEELLFLTDNYDNYLSKYQKPNQIFITLENLFMITIGNEFNNNNFNWMPKWINDCKDIFNDNRIFIICYILKVFDKAYQNEQLIQLHNQDVLIKAEKYQKQTQILLTNPYFMKKRQTSKPYQVIQTLEYILRNSNYCNILDKCHAMLAQLIHQYYDAINQQKKVNLKSQFVKLYTSLQSLEKFLLCSQQSELQRYLKISENCELYLLHQKGFKQEYENFNNLLSYDINDLHFQSLQNFAQLQENLSFQNNIKTLVIQKTNFINYSSSNSQDKLNQITISYQIFSQLQRLELRTNLNEFILYDFESLKNLNNLVCLIIDMKERIKLYDFTSNFDRNYKKGSTSSASQSLISQFYKLMKLFETKQNFEQIRMDKNLMEIYLVEEFIQYQFNHDYTIKQKDDQNKLQAKPEIDDALNNYFKQQKDDSEKHKKIFQLMISKVLQLYNRIDIQVKNIIDENDSKLSIEIEDLHNKQFGILIIIIKLDLQSKQVVIDEIKSRSRDKLTCLYSHINKQLDLKDIIHKWYISEIQTQNMIDIFGEQYEISCINNDYLYSQIFIYKNQKNSKIIPINFLHNKYYKFICPHLNDKIIHNNNFFELNNKKYFELEITFSSTLLSLDNLNLIFKMLKINQNCSILNLIQQQNNKLQSQKDTITIKDCPIKNILKIHKLVTLQIHI